MTQAGLAAILILIAARAVAATLVELPEARDSPPRDRLSPLAWLRAQAAQKSASAAIPQSSFAWPLAVSKAIDDFGYYAIVYHVDLDPSSGVLDYQCGARSYDGHQGNDLSLAPFAWTRMDRMDVAAIAARSGTLIERTDGAYDRNCDRTQSHPLNYVGLLHDDGSYALYFHLKSGSVTTKPLGSRIAQGEYLGFVGSSGNSSGPHLHIEIHDAANRVIEPFSGACNAGPSLWSDPVPYTLAMVNRLDTASAPPMLGPCPQDEIANAKTIFNPGDPLVPVAYYRDFDVGPIATWQVTEPDGTVFASGTDSNSDRFYAAAYMYWTLTLPNPAPLGRWLFSMNFGGQTFQRPFTVAAKPAADSPIVAQNGWWWNPAEGGRGFAIERNPASDTIFFGAYMYDPSGAAVWYAGTLAPIGAALYSGALNRYQSGAASQTAIAQLSFSSERAGNLWIAGSGLMPVNIAIQRFVFAQNRPAQALPETGWWWNPAQPGSGYFLESQSASLFVGRYAYDSAGNPVWAISQGAMIDAADYSGALAQYQNGQTLDGAYRPAAPLTGSGETINVMFSSANSGAIISQDGARTPIQRFRF